MYRLCNVTSFMECTFYIELYIYIPLFLCLVLIHALCFPIILTLYIWITVKFWICLRSGIVFFFWILCHQHNHCNTKSICRFLQSWKIYTFGPFFFAHGVTYSWLPIIILATRKCLFFSNCLLKFQASFSDPCLPSLAREPPPPKTPSKKIVNLKGFSKKSSSPSRHRPPALGCGLCAGFSMTMERTVQFFIDYTFFDFCRILSCHCSLSAPTVK